MEEASRLQEAEMIFESSGLSREGGSIAEHTARNRECFYRPRKNVFFGPRWMRVPRGRVGVLKRPSLQRTAGLLARTAERERYAGHRRCNARREL